jgi:uncharacterized membrane protein
VIGEHDDLPEAAMELGPVQMLVVGFEHGRFDGSILAELKRLRESDVIRVIDLLFVTKREDGELESRQETDLDADEARQLGALIGGLIGLSADGEEGAQRGAAAGAADLADTHLFDESDVRDVADAIPPGSSAGIALIEHRWAIPLRSAITGAGGVSLRDQWVSAADLATAGMNRAIAGGGPAA